MSLVISKVFTYDTDAGDYIQAVEAADGQALEAGTRQAINNFVIGCKQDGIWNAIKASCILSGARTRLGALTPLVGTALTSFNFVDGDYNRKTGLLGNGTNKSLRTGLLANALSNTSNHLFFNGSNFSTAPASTQNYGGVYNGSSLSSLLDIITGTIGQREIRSGALNAPAAAAITTGLITSGSVSGTRISATDLRLFQNGATAAVNTISNTPTLPAIGFGVFARNDNGTQSEHCSAQFNFFSIGDGLTQASMASLHARVTALITAFGVAIP